ncbi:MAG: DEAD/DEAH box helicase [Acidimicrobiaceae bacterium]|nr:DEAD/DEAH box helicase [Acidimicrobiaceae bacterium]
MSPTFAQLGVPDSICRALDERGITQPFDIQAAAMADAMAGHDICGRAPTGSGKTLAFGIPLVATAVRARPHRPTALVLAPTRELADQIMTELRSFAGGVRVAVVYGGVGYGRQMEALRRGVDILVACPGRLEDLIEQGVVSLAAVEAVVIDEADRMADMGFIPAVRRLLDQTSPDRQTMLFSATLDGDVASLTREYQYKPVRCEVGEETPDVIAADHVFWNVARAERIGVAADAITASGSAIVFCRTRHGCDRLARQLDRAGIATAAIHGGRSQNQRTRALGEFASGRVQALIATDVAARGIHVQGVDAVIHFDAPEDHKAYLHRSGRTARAGQGGVVVSLVLPEQAREMGRMQRQLGLEQPITEVDMAAIAWLRESASHSEPARRSEPDTASRDSDRPRRSSQPRRDSERSGAGHKSRSRRSSRPQRSRNRNRNRRPSAKRAA